jgi:hypothetical protein
MKPGSGLRNEAADNGQVARDCGEMGQRCHGAGSGANRGRERGLVERRWMEKHSVVDRPPKLMSFSPLMASALFVADGDFVMLGERNIQRRPCAPRMASAAARDDGREDYHRRQHVRDDMDDDNMQVVRSYLTCRHFGMSGNTFYRWPRRYQEPGAGGLEDGSHRRPELTSRALDQWAYEAGVQLQFIDPGKPQ